MAKKSWLNLVRSFFMRNKKSKQLKKEKRRRWLSGRVTVKRLTSVTTAPSSSNERTMNEAEQEESMQALTMAIATVQAAQACVTAAQVAAEVVGLASISEPIQGCKEQEQDLLQAISKTEIPQAPLTCKEELERSAAIDIQAAFRGYLARKALRALKGIVKLQALIRGRLVRHQAASTLKYLQSIVSIQSQVSAMRLQMTERKSKNDDVQKKLSPTGKITRMDSKRDRRWDTSLMSERETDVAMKRERIKEYTLRHRKSAETERSNADGRWSYWLEQWVDIQLSKSKEFEDLDSVPSSKEDGRRQQLRLKATQRRSHNHVAEMVASPTCMPRKSRSKYQSKQDDSCPDPVVPTYMAATESAKAKVRSVYSPKQMRVSFDTCSESYSPHKNKLCFMSSVDSDVLSTASHHQRSLSLKGLPVKSSCMRKDLTFGSDSSLPN